VPQVVFELDVPLARDAVQHLAKRALELLPVLLLRQDLVDALERLQEERIQIERLVEGLDGAVEILLLVAIDLRHRVDVLRLALRVRLDFRDGLQRLDHLRPVRGALVELEQLVKQHVVVRLDVQSLLVGLDGLVRVLLLIRPDVANLDEHFETLVGFVHIVENLSLVRADLFPVLELGVHRDERLERGPVRWVHGQRFFEVVDGLFALALLALDRSELLVDVRSRFDIGFVEAGQDLLIVRQRPRPVLQAE